jgi:hypothetical protein
LGAPNQGQEKKAALKDQQLRLYLGPELVKVSGR